MYSRLGRSIVNFKPLKHEFRNYSVISGSLVSDPKHIIGIQNPYPPRATDKIISGAMMTRRQFSVSGFRFQDVGAQALNVGSDAAISSENILEAAAVNLSNVSPDSSLGASEPVLSAAGTSSEAAANISETAASVSDTKEILLDFLPEKPVPLDPTAILGEPGFDTLGLGSWWPSGRLQLFMEYLHVDLGLEWYQAILFTALCMRMITFPFVVMSQKNMVNMNNNMPGMAALQEKMTDARRRGDSMESAIVGNQLQAYMKKTGINPIKNVLPILVQMPIFMSMFLGLRGMSNLPVPSLEHGGILWFENFAMSDPFYLLPILTSTTIYLQVRMGADGNRLESMGPMGRVLMTCLPFALVPISINFPCAITYYWFMTNLISITQASVLRIPTVRSALNIPQLIKRDKNQPGGKKKGFKESIRESVDNFRLQNDIADRRALDEQMFKEAGSAKPIKVYPYDPSKPVSVRPKH